MQPIECEKTPLVDKAFLFLFLTEIFEDLNESEGDRLKGEIRRRGTLMGNILIVEEIRQRTEMREKRSSGGGAGRATHRRSLFHSQCSR